ncbi:MAG TPA: hypothetical protein VLM40_12730, partial [Gemmata sp.]|nr:hypothetical protein [Gemmata sp.]
MASLAEGKSEPVAKFMSQVDEQIAQASSRIKIHDITLGMLALAAMVAVYATVMVLVDKSLNLSEWVRQICWFAFVVAGATIGFFLFARPLLKPINPLYAAARVEDTIEDAKNSLTGYVEAHEKGDVHPAVKAAMSAKAARAVGDADVNQAISNRSLVVAGGVFVAFLLALAVLFFTFRATQFNSLIGRALFPFSSSEIATRTQLTLLRPDPADPTITTGQTITVAVRVGGKVPAKSDPERVRVLLRHNPADPNYEEVPMNEGETQRDWSIKVPEYLVQNGFWYKVAAGDAETPEFKVTVRSLPLFTDFEARYEYPKYTRKPSDLARDPNIRGLRGTKVTLIAKTNRQVKSGLMRFDTPGLAPAVGKPVTEKSDSLLFQFTIKEPTRYRLSMTTQEDEHNPDMPPFSVSVDSDQPPRVEITRPEGPESSAAANGQLAVDGTVGDDFGIDKIRLCMRIAGRDLKPVFYNEGKSLRREKDNSWPTDLSAAGGFKLSADLTKLRFADESHCELKVNDVIEYWVEAIDNCSETKPVEGWGEKLQAGNVGSSQPVQKLKLSEPKSGEAEKQELDKSKQARRNEEQKHNASQQQQLNNEERQPPKPDADKKPQDDHSQQPKDEKGESGKKQDAQPQGGKGENGRKDQGEAAERKQQPGNKSKDSSNDSNQAGDPSAGKPKAAEKKKDASPKPNDAGAKGGSGAAKDANDTPQGKSPEGKSGGEKSPESNPMEGTKSTENRGGMNPQSGPETAPPPKSAEEKEFEKQLEQVQKERDKLRGEGGEAKPNRTSKPEERTNPAEGKPESKGGQGDASQSKTGTKPGPMDQPGGEKKDAAATKPEGNLQQPPNPDPEKKPGTPGEMQSSEKHEPLGGSAGRDKESPEPKKGTDASDPRHQKDDRSAGAQPKPASGKKDESGSGENQQPKDPAAGAGAAKPNTEPSRGMDKDTQAAGEPMKTSEPKADPQATASKPQRATPSAETKPRTPDGKSGKEPDSRTGNQAPGEELKPQRGSENASAAKPEPKSPMHGGMADDKKVQRGVDKTQTKEQGGSAPGGAPKDKKELASGGKSANQKLDQKQRQAIQDAAKDLNDPDPTKQQAARDKLDQMVGKDNRKAIEEFQKERKKELEQLSKDLQSSDEQTKENARKKLEDLQKKAEQIAQGNDGGKKDG